MSLQPYKIVAIARTDAGGSNIIPNATVAIINGSGGYQSLFESDLTTPIGNPATADANGELEVWIDPGYYTVTVSGGQSWPIVVGMSVDRKTSYADMRAIGATYPFDTIILSEEGKSGIFRYDSADAVSADNDGTTIVDTAGRRWKRFYSGPISAKWFGVIADGVVSDDAAWTKAKDFAESVGGEIDISDCNSIRLTATSNIQAPISIVGVYPQPYIGGIGTRGKGSWFFFDHSGVGFNIAGPLMSGVFLDKFGTYRSQPAPAPAWAPSAHDFDIVFDNCDLVIGDIMLYNPTKGIKGINGNAGRIRINTLRGQPLQVGIDLDSQYDAPSIGMIHFWPFWQDDANVHAYTLQNLDALYFKRVDNPFIQSIFTIFARAGLRIGESASGTTNKFRIGQADFDRGNFGVWCDTTVSSGSRGQVANLSIQGESGLSGTKGMFVQGNNSYIQIANLDIRVSDQNGIRVEGSSNEIVIGHLVNKSYDQASGGFGSVEALIGNRVRIDSFPDIDASGLGVRYSGAGLIFVDEWRGYAPVVTATTGAITTLGTVSGSYKLFENTIDYEIDIAVTTNGTGSGAIRSTLPLSSGPNIFVGNGRELNVSGHSLSCTVNSSSTTCDITKYDNSYPAVDGCRMVVNGSYRIA